MEITRGTVPSVLCTVRDCHQPLTIDDRRAVCPRNHSYDRARSGYWNLLQPQDRKSKIPGDPKSAVEARRRFVDRGHVDALHQALVDVLRPIGARTLLDVGCGEGFHLGGFRRDLGVEAHGTDLSLPAIEHAAKRHRDCTFAVANADRFVPYESNSIDALTSITARMTPDEFHRVLSPDGVAMIVIPAPDDLIELRAAVLGAGEERDRVERTVSTFADHFELVRHERFRMRLTLDRDSIHDVLSSSYRGLRTREQERLARLEAMEITSSRDILLFKRK